MACTADCGAGVPPVTAREHGRDGRALEFLHFAETGEAHSVGPQCRSGFQPDPAVFTLSGRIRLSTGPAQPGAPRRESSPRRPLRRSLAENRWSSAVTKKSGWKPDLRNRAPLVGRDRGGALCAGVSRRIGGGLPLRRSPVGNRTYAIGCPSSGEIAAAPFAPESRGESMVVCGYEGVRLETGPAPLAPFVSCRTVRTPEHGRDGRATTSATIDRRPIEAQRILCTACS
jgi:hypothetical protein